MNTPSISDFVKGIIEISKSASKATSLSFTSLAVTILSIINHNTIQTLASPSPSLIQADGSYNLPSPCPDLRLSYILSRLSTAIYGDDFIKVQEFPDDHDVKNVFKLGARITRETTRSVVKTVFNTYNNIKEWATQNYEEKDKGNLRITKSITEKMKKDVTDSFVTIGQIHPSQIIHINIPSNFMEPLWSIVEIEDYTILVIRGTWSFGDVIADVTAKVQQLYNPPIPPSSIMTIQDEKVRDGFPSRFRDIDKDKLDEVKRLENLIMEQGEKDNLKAFLDASREILYDGKSGRKTFLDDPKEVEECYAHTGFIIASSYVYYMALPYMREGARRGRKLIVTGHSLGAGLASLVGFHLKDEFPSINVYAFAPPAAVSKKLSIMMRDYVTTYILMNDVVPRLSLYANSNMLKRIEKMKKSEERDTDNNNNNNNNNNRITPDEDELDIEDFTLDDGETLLPPGRLYHILYRDSETIMTRSKLVKERILKDHSLLTPSTTDVILEYEEGFERVNELPLIPSSILNHKPLDYTLGLLEICLAFGVIPQSYEDMKSIIWF